MIISEKQVFDLLLIAKHVALKLKNTLYYVEFCQDLIQEIMDQQSTELKVINDLKSPEEK
jgi:hypothetical protein